MTNLFATPTAIQFEPDTRLVCQNTKMPASFFNVVRIMDNRFYTDKNAKDITVHHTRLVCQNTRLSK